MKMEDFENYVKDRYEKTTRWYDEKASTYKNYYSRLQFFVIVLSAITPVLVGIAPKECLGDDVCWLKWLTVFVSVAVAIITTLLKTFKLQENWITYRTTAETLKKEIHLYRAAVDQYSKDNDKEALFVERVESLISRENTLWLTSYKKDGQEKPEPPAKIN